MRLEVQLMLPLIVVLELWVIIISEPVVAMNILHTGVYYRSGDGALE